MIVVVDGAALARFSLAHAAAGGAARFRRACVADGRGCVDGIRADMVVTPYPAGVTR